MKLLRYATLAFSLVFTSSVAVKAQSVDDIIKKYVEAKGGTENWKKVKSIKMTGAINAGGQEMQVTQTVVLGKASRMDMTIAGMANYQIVTTKDGWSYWPIGGMTKPEPMTEDEVKQSADELDLDGPLVNYKDKGNTVTLLGKDEIEGTECYKIKVVYKSGKEATLCIDASNYYLIREIAKVKADGKETEQTINFSNFKKLPEGILFPMTMGTGQGEIAFKTIDVNPTIDESIFKPKN